MRVALAVAMALSLVSIAAADQADAAIRKHTDIPAQSLGMALKSFAEERGLAMIYRAEVVSQLRTTGASGELTLDEALQALLRGTELTYKFLDEQTVTIVPLATAPSLKVGSDSTAGGGQGSWEKYFVNERAGVTKPLRVSQASSAEVSSSDSTREASAASGLDEVIVSGRRIDTVSMMKRGETLRDTPQSVTIMTQQRIEEQKLVSVSEVLDQVPGITVDLGYFGKPGTYYSRGFQITNIQIDGASVDASSVNYFNPNLAVYEQVEVLRGADGLFVGNGDPSGTVNLARKRGQHTPRIMMDVTAGRWDNYSAQLDVGGPVALDGRLRARAVARWHDKEFFYDTAKERGVVFYGTVEGDVTDRTVLIAGASHEESKEKPWMGGLPRLKSGEEFEWPRSRSLMAGWSRWDSDAWEAFLKVEHKFSDNWQLVAGATHGRSQTSLMLGSVSGGDFNNPFAGVDPENPIGVMFPVGYDYDSKRTVFDITLQGKFELFGRQHSVLLGADKQTIDNISMTSAATWDDGSWYGPEVDLHDFGPATTPYPTGPVYMDSWGNNMTRQNAVYGKLLLQIAEPLRVIFGGRYFNYDYHRPYEFYDSAGNVIDTGGIGYKESGVFNPYYGALFDVSKNWTLYASLTEIYRSQAGNLSGPPPGRALDPMTGRNYELGAKGELREGRLGASFALYRTERKGQAEQDFNYPPSSGGESFMGNCCYLALGEIVSQGVDAEISGEVLPGWSVFAGYTLNENENKRTDRIFLSRAPKHIFKLWTTYKVPALERRLTVGGGLTSQTSRYVSGTVQPYNPDTGLYDGDPVSFDFTQGGYTVINAMAQYEISPAWSLSINANNILDKTYYRGIGTLNWGNHYGEPRNLMLTVRSRF